MTKIKERHSMSFTGSDRKLVTSIIEQGIDSRLEGFCHSHFSDDGHRLSCKIADEDFQVFVRRLSEHVEQNADDENASMLLDDVVRVFIMEEYEGY